jgi:hypothetical protein
MFYFGRVADFAVSILIEVTMKVVFNAIVDGCSCGPRSFSAVAAPCLAGSVQFVTCFLLSVRRLPNSVTTRCSELCLAASSRLVVCVCPRCLSLRLLVSWGPYWEI